MRHMELTFHHVFVFLFWNRKFSVLDADSALTRSDVEI